MKALTLTMFIFFSVLTNASEKEIPSRLQVRSGVTMEMSCSEFIANLANDLHKIKSAVSSANMSIHRNTDVGAQYTQAFLDSKHVLDEAHRATELLFNKAMDCHTTSGQIVD